MEFNDPNVLRFSDVNKKSDNPDIVITGIPYDGGIISHRRGSRYGPEKIRNIIDSYSTYCTDHNEDLNSLKIYDAGDINVNFIDYDINKIIDDYYNIIKSKNSRFIAFGGDHSITEGLFKAVCKLNKKTGMILFDAHHDIRDPWRINSGSWGNNILNGNGGCLDGKNFVQIGVRGFKYSKYYYNKIKNLNISYFTSLNVFDEGIEKIIKKAFNIIDAGIIYASLDIDVVDQAYAPGVSAASPGGLTPRELFKAMYLLGLNKRVRFVDVTEYSPPLDHDDITGRTASEAILHFMCGVSKSLSSP